MVQIGLLSDTHSFFHPKIEDYFSDCNEIWHAGDFGNSEVINQLKEIAPVRGVHGNIDSREIQLEFPENMIFFCEGIKVFMTHIGGYPGRYNSRVNAILAREKPGLFICGHSHICKIMPDRSRSLLHINPGAAGREGFHRVITIVKFQIHEGKFYNMQVIELGKRGG